MVLLQQLERPPHAAQHAQPQHVDLHELEGVDVVLVPLDDLPVGHGGGLDRHQVVQPVLGQHEAAGMGAELAREADQLAGDLQGEPQAAVPEVEVERLGMLLEDAVPGPGRDLGRQRRRHVLGQPHDLADVADGAARAEAHDGGAQGGPVAAVALVDPLDHLLAPLALEVDVDVRRLPALGRDEALEQQPGAHRVDGGDAQHVADGGVGGGSASLAQDVLRPGVADDAVHGQEVGRVAEAADEVDLVPQLPGHVLGQAVRVAQRDAVPDRALQRLLRRLARHVGLVRILVAQLRQAEAAAVGDLRRARQRLGVVAEQPPHLGGALEVAVGEPLLAEAGLVDGAALADAGHHVLQDAPVRGVEQHVAGDHGRHPRRLRHVVQPTQPHRVAGTAAQGQGQVAAAAEARAETAELLLQAAVRLVRQQDDQQALAVGDQVPPGDVAAALAGAALAQGQQPAQAPVGCAVGRVGQHGQAIAQVQAAPHDEADADLLGTGMGAGYAGQRVVVGDGQGLEARSPWPARAAPRRGWRRAGRSSSR